MNSDKVGVILTASSLLPVYASPEAVRILSYPEQLGHISNPVAFVADRIRKILLNGSQSREAASTAQFFSGRRLYICRTFQLDTNSISDKGQTRSPLSLVIMLERFNNSAILRTSEIAAKFRLTHREQVALDYILKGMTTKEIAESMGISPNTVKSFLRLIMSKMGVMTRSGIAGKVVSCLTDSDARRANSAC